MLPKNKRQRIITYLWTFAAIVALLLAARYLFASNTVLAIHWLVVAAIASRVSYVRIAKSSDQGPDPSD